MSIPSATTIQRCGCDRKTALLIRRILDGRANPELSSKACEKWVRACYNEPSRSEKALCAIDDLLGNHGVEGFELKGSWYSYSNTGDSYTCTVIYKRGKGLRLGRWIVGSWGDLVESLER